MRRRLAAFFLSLALMGTFVPGVAFAAHGVVVDPSALPAATRALLTADIAAARKADSRAFDAVASVRGRLGEIDAQKRGRLAPMTLVLKRLGRDALLPMVEELAFDAAPRGDLAEAAWTAWRAGLVEAIGTWRDPRTETVLLAVLDGTDTDPLLVRVAAEAVGRLGTDAGAQRLVELAETPGPKQAAVLAGMGGCRRVVSVDALARALAADPSAETAVAIIKSLGTAGNWGAWSTPALDPLRGEEEAVRSGAARALLDAFVAWDGHVRRAASNALMVVDWAGTPALVAQARASADTETAAALDALSARFARNPARRSR